MWFASKIRKLSMYLPLVHVLSRFFRVAAQFYHIRCPPLNVTIFNTHVRMCLMAATPRMGILRSRFIAMVFSLIARRLWVRHQAKRRHECSQVILLTSYVISNLVMAKLFHFLRKLGHVQLLEAKLIEHTSPICLVSRPMVIERRNLRRVLGLYWNASH